MRKLLRKVPVLVIATIPACASATLTFETEGPAEVSLVTFDHLDGAGKSLGRTPLTVEVDKVSGKAIKITQPGKLPVYWVVADVAGKTNVARVKLLETPQSQNTEAEAKKEPEEAKNPLADIKATTNRVMRLLLRAYQALSGRRYQLASELADKASTIDPEIAAPHVIKGIALMQQGDQEGAKASLTKAKALDPEDLDIDELLKVVR